jgi:hypothetical protein
MKHLEWPLFLCFVCALAACYKPRRGCLDPNGVNFDVNADVDTGCVYPSLVLEFAHLHDGDGLSFDSIYTNNLGQKYRIKDVAFYLSGVQFTKGTEITGLTDTFHAFVPISPSANDSSRISPIFDIALVRRSTLSTTIGSFPKVDSFDGISLDFGLRKELVDVLPGSVRAGHPLRPQPEMLYDSTAREHRFARLVLELNPPTSVTDTLWITDAEFAVGGNKITTKTPLIQKAGYNFKVKIGVDYRLWFVNTDLSKPKSAIVSQIASSALGGFYITQ